MGVQRSVREMARQPFPTAQGRRARLDMCSVNSLSRPYLSSLPWLSDMGRPRQGEQMAGLHLVCIDDNQRLWHTIRRLDGTWFPFGDVRPAALGQNPASLNPGGRGLPRGRGPARRQRAVLAGARPQPHARISADQPEHQRGVLQRRRGEHVLAGQVDDRRQLQPIHGGHRRQRTTGGRVCPRIPDQRQELPAGVSGRA